VHLTGGLALPLHQQSNILNKDFEGDSQVMKMDHVLGSNANVQKRGETSGLGPHIKAKLANKNVHILQLILIEVGKSQNRVA
jgi:hypothetical protein